MRHAQSVTGSALRGSVRNRLRAFTHAAIGGGALLCIACGSEQDLGSNTSGYNTPPTSSAIGLYTPDNAAGKPPPVMEGDGNYTKAELAAFALREGQGSGGCATPTVDMGLTVDQVATDKAMGVDLTKRARTPGTLSMTFMTKALGGKWAPANVGAVWVQDVQQRSVKRLETWAAERITSLVFYNQNTCSTDATDVVTRATLVDHTTMHHDTWNTKDFVGNIVPDGTYVIWIEVADVEDITAPPTTFTFYKGAGPISMSVPNADGTVGLQYTYTPASVAATSSNTQP